MAAGRSHGVGLDRIGSVGESATPGPARLSRPTNAEDPGTDACAGRGSREASGDVAADDASRGRSADSTSLRVGDRNSPTLSLRQTSNTEVATISSNTGTKGLVTTVAYGTTTITASNSSQTVSGNLTVQSPPLASIAVTPSSPTIASGTAVQSHATGTFADNSTADLTTQVSWTSSNTAVATVSNTSGSQGLTTGVNPGNTTITATLNGVSGTASVTCNDIGTEPVVHSPSCSAI